MIVEKQAPFDEKMRIYKDAFIELKKIQLSEFSVLDEISARISITLHLSDLEIILGVAKEKKDLIPKALYETINFFHKLSKESEYYFLNNSSESLNASILFLKMRLKYIESFLFIKKGLLKNAQECMFSIIDFLNSGIDLKGPQSPGDFSDFWNSFKITKNAFEKYFSSNSFSIERYFEYERSSILDALEGKFESATARIINLHTFVSSNSISKYEDAKIKKFV